VKTFGPIEKDPLAVIVPALQIGAVPFRRGPEGALMTRIAESMLIGLASVGVNPRLVREPVPALTPDEPPPTLVGLESVSVAWLVAPRIAQPIWDQIRQWVAEGGRLYVAYSDTFWFANLAHDLGIHNTGPYNQRFTRQGTLTVRRGQDVWRWQTSTAIPVAPLTSRGAEPWAYWDTGDAALFRWPVGQGEIIVAAGGWELSERPEDVLMPLYRAVLESWSVPLPFRVERAGVQWVESVEGRVLLMNHGNAPAEVQLAAPLADEHGQSVTRLTLDPGDWWWGRQPR
jgi:hypothetical protein